MVKVGCLRLRTTSLSTKQPVTSTQQSPLSRSSWCQETKSEINPSKAQALWCTLYNKAVGQAIPAVSFNGETIERTNILKYLDPIRHNTDEQDSGRINKTQVQERTVRLESHGFKSHRTTSFVPAVSGCVTMVWVSQPCHSLTG